MRATASWVECSSQVKLVRIRASHPRGFDSAKGCRNVPPTTLTKTSHRAPKRVSAPSKNSDSASASRGVELGGHHLASGIGQHRRHLVQRSSVPVAQRQVHTGAAEVDGAGAADAAPASDDDGHTAGQVGPIIEIAHGAPLSSWSLLSSVMSVVVMVMLVVMSVRSGSADPCGPPSRSR